MSLQVISAQSLETSCDSLSSAIILSKDGDHIFIKPGVYLENTLASISKNVTIEGLDSDNSKTQIYLAHLNLLASCSIKNVSIYCNQQICAVRGAHIIENCRILFEYGNCSLQVWPPSHFTFRDNFIQNRQSNNALPALSISGGANIIGNMFEGFNTVAISVISTKQVTIQRNNIHDTQLGIHIHGCKASITGNILKNCGRAIQIAHSTDSSISGNYFSQCIFGVDIVGPSRMDITGNTFVQSIGPSIRMQAVHPVFIKNNDFSFGKTVAVKLKYTDFRKQTAESNTFNGFPLGAIGITDKNLEIIVNTMNMLLVHGRLSLSYLSGKIKSSLSELMQVLFRYPDIFGITNDIVSWSNDLHSFKVTEKSTAPPSSACQTLATVPTSRDTGHIASPAKPKRKKWTKYAKNRKIFDRTGGLCYLCKKPLKFENRLAGQEGAWRVEHVLPFSKYPEMDKLANLLPAHIECDNSKGANRLHSIIHETDFELLTLDVNSLDPKVTHELKKSKEKKQNASKKKSASKTEQPVEAKLPPKSPRSTKKAISIPEELSTITIESPQPEPHAHTAPAAPMVIFSNQHGIHDSCILKYHHLTISQDKIGEGSFSTVWKGYYNGTPVAIKSMNKEDSELTPDFKRELTILSNLRHPNVVLMLGVCVPPDPCLIVTELFEKNSLQHILNAKPEISIQQKIGFALDIAKGMCYLHNAQILHLDLKPLNIMVDKAGSCKIADFGSSRIATLCDGLLCASNNGMVGTLAYMAPEILAEDTTIDTKADVYSFGITLWQIHTQSNPWKGFPKEKILEEVLENQRRPPIPLQCPYGYGSLMEACWNHSPLNRTSFHNAICKLQELDTE